MSAPNSSFVRACKSQLTDHTPVWFMRQAGRYMPEYRAVRKQHSLLEICKKPSLAAEVTITAAEILGVDAAIIFADLLLPLEVMGLPFHFSPTKARSSRSPFAPKRTSPIFEPTALPIWDTSPKRFLLSRSTLPIVCLSSDSAALLLPLPAT